MRRPWPCTLVLAVVAGMALGVLGVGCATQSDLNDQARRLQGMIAEQSRSIEGLRRDVERLRADLDEGTRKKGGAPRPAPKASDKDRLNALDKRLQNQPAPGSEQLGETLSPEGMSTEQPGAPDQAVADAGGSPPGSPPPATETAPTESGTPQALAAAPPSSPPQPAPPAPDADWKREVAQDRAVASTTNTPERAEYLAALDGLAYGDCSKAGPRLYAISTGSTSSPLSDDVLYWEGRCLALRGDYRQALSKLRQVVSRYPRGDKAPAALWEEGRLLMRTGDASSARQALAKLIHDYPATTEAAQARRKLAEAEH
jgi:TolA-binding protein